LSHTETIRNTVHRLVTRLLTETMPEIIIKTTDQKTRNTSA
jgi:hypothetical protein